MIAQPDDVHGAAPSLADLLAKRLPAGGPILALGNAAPAPLSERDGVQRRALDDRATISPAILEPGGWRAIVVDAARVAAPATGAASLEALRRALDPEGRLFVVLAASGEPDGHEGPQGVAAAAIGALFEARFCLVHEDTVAVESGRASPATTLVLEARPDQHVVRPYRDGDETAIVRLFAESFSPSRGLDHWRWKYRDNPFGTLAISCAFGPTGELVAHYAAYPVPFRRSRADGPETVLCHQVGDTMTDRRHRHVGRGRTSLLGRTARHFYARRCEGKVAFNYGFNTGNIQRFSQLFVGARKVWDVELWSSPAGDLRLTAPRRFRPYRATRIDRLGAEFDDFFERVAPRYGLLVERRRPYVEWRYLRCPDVAYRLYRVDRGRHLVGWGVVRADGDRLLLGDALFDPEHPDAVSAWLREANGGEDGRRAAERRIEGWFSRHPSWWCERLTALGFTAAPQPQGLGMVFVPFLECPQQELESSYYLTMGDSDLF
ncbi:MAG TPA: hypothetical protein VHR17_12680 [Thermoanaerobaculia bacterium]|nr:hypothetical protein [Thermoanaerobaculia bacterium]